MSDNLIVIDSSKDTFTVNELIKILFTVDIEGEYELSFYLKTNDEDSILIYSSSTDNYRDNDVFTFEEYSSSFLSFTLNQTGEYSVYCVLNNGEGTDLSNTLNITVIESDNNIPDNSEIIIPESSSEDSVLNTFSENKGDTVFQTRVFLEKNKQVYGAEVIVFDEYNNSIDNILITDETDFEKYVNALNALLITYTPYSSKDRENLDIILNYYSNTSDTILKNEYLEALDSMSKLQKKGDLQTILYNNANLDDGVLKGYSDEFTDYSNCNRGEQIIINATHLNGRNSGEYSLTNHSHKEYLEGSHAIVNASENTLGHVRLVDNLTTNGLNGSSALSANQGRILKNEIDNVSRRNKWSSTMSLTKNGYIKYKVNEDLRLCVCNYNREDYTGLKSTTGKHILHNPATIPEKYRPSSRVLTSLYRGDVTLYYGTDGSVNLYNLTKLDKINIHAQVMWHY